MSNAATAGSIVSLDDYRRSRGERRMATRHPTGPVPHPAAAVWVYWVPVWVW